VAAAPQAAHLFTFRLMSQTDSFFRNSRASWCADGIVVTDAPVDATDPVPVCSEYEMQCADGNCVDSRYRCDGHFDCPDGSDESECESTFCLVSCLLRHQTHQNWGIFYDQLQ